MPCPYGQLFDRLWVKEVWAAGACADGLRPAMRHPGTWKVDNGGLWYPADATEPKHPISPRGKTRVSIHMPRWASRITLEITGVRVERLNDCGEADAIAEGIAPELDGWTDYSNPSCQMCLNPVDSYRTLWDSINGAGAWEANAWGWVVEFRRVQR